jgi:hypothetical protein
MHGGYEDRLESVKYARQWRIESCRHLPVLLDATWTGKRWKYILAIAAHVKESDELVSG